MERLVFDTETDGLRPSQIWAVGIYSLDTGEYSDYVLDDVCEGLVRLQQAKLVVGHYIKGYDLPVIKRLTEGLIDIPLANAVDTLDLSRTLFPGLPNHKLSTWGDLLGFPKLTCLEGFDHYSPQMREYMKRDVMLNVRVYEFLIDHASQARPEREILLS